MSFLPEFVPKAVSIVFLLAFFFPVGMVANLFRKGGRAEQQGRKIAICILLFYGLYLLYVSVAAFNGVFDELSLPPKILKFTMFPLAAFLLLVVFNLSIYKAILRRLQLDDLVRVHVFRLVGSFFLILGFFEALPLSIALLAGLGDVITALTSLFVARVIRQKKSFAIRLTWLWNSFGLLDIIATSVTALILTKISLDTGVQGVEALASFPFCFIPAFAPATIVFLHLSVYRKLIGER